jgi:glycosyltransferase involved in cell wall biosynthesis
MTLGLPTESPIALAVGALSAEKRIDMAIRAIGEVPEMRLVIVGDGPERQRLEALASGAAANRVLFVGPVDDVRPYLAAADLLLLTSDSEGLPGVVIEAGMSGLPAVVTDVGYVRDIVIDGTTGAVVPQGDPKAIADALTRVYAGRKVMGMASRSHCERAFDLTMVVDLWVEMLSVASRPRRNARRPLLSSMGRDSR